MFSSDHIILFCMFGEDKSNGLLLFLSLSCGQQWSCGQILSFLSSVRLSLANMDAPPIDALIVQSEFLWMNLSWWYGLRTFVAQLDVDICKVGQPLIALPAGPPPQLYHSTPAPTISADLSLKNQFFWQSGWLFSEQLAILLGSGWVCQAFGFVQSLPDLVFFVTKGLVYEVCLCVINCVSFWWQIQKALVYLCSFLWLTL